MSRLLVLQVQQNAKRSLLNTWQNDHNWRMFALCPLWNQKAKQDSRTSGLEVSSSGASSSQVSADVRPLGEKIKENTKTASYTAIVVAGIGVTAVMFWAIFRELFSSFSPNNIYSDALQRVIEDYRVQDSIGAPIKGYGEESRRGRRQHVAHSSFERKGVPHIRMKFYAQGIRNKATVHLEARKNPQGKMEYRYLFVQLDHYPHTTIILEDNRASDLQTSPSSSFGANQDTSLPNLSFASFDAKK